MSTLKHKISSSGGTHAIDADLDNIRVKELPRIEFDTINTKSDISIKELPTIEIADINTHSDVSTQSDVSIKELPKIEIDANTSSNVNVAITKIPDVRTHLPSHYNLGFSVFGMELFNFSLCGESQIITEEYVPRRMEICK